MKALNDVVESGKVRYIGASSVSIQSAKRHFHSRNFFSWKMVYHTYDDSQMAAWEFQTLQNIAARKGWHQFISMQNYHNLIAREEEREMIPYCLDSGVGLIPWSPMARGVLTRPWGSRSSVRENTDGALKMLIRSRETESDKAIVDRVEELAGKKGVSMAQISLAWSLGHQSENPIVGLSSIERIDEAVASLKITLTSEEIQYLEEPYVAKAVAPLER
jgi:aryl-alcohol dehydrogenase-like predicted oxidoreductase